VSKTSRVNPSSRDLAAPVEPSSQNDMIGSLLKVTLNGEVRFSHAETSQNTYRLRPKESIATVGHRSRVLDLKALVTFCVPLSPMQIMNLDFGFTRDYRTQA